MGMGKVKIKYEVLRTLIQAGVYSHNNLAAAQSKIHDLQALLLVKDAVAGAKVKIQDDLDEAQAGLKGRDEFILALLDRPERLSAAAFADGEGQGAEFSVTAKCVREALGSFGLDCPSWAAE